MARNSLLCADVPLRNYSLTHCSAMRSCKFLRHRCENDRRSGVMLPIMSSSKRLVFIAILFTNVDGNHATIPIIRICVRFCLSVCLKLKSLNWAKRWSITIPRPPINIRSKGQRSRSQGQKMQKHIQGNKTKTDDTTISK